MNDNIQSKICSKCKINKNINEFHKNSLYCKLCYKEYYKVYYDKNKEKKIEYKKLHKEKCLGYARKHYAANKDKIKAEKIEYRKNNLKKVKDQERSYYYRNKTEIKQKRKLALSKNKIRNEKINRENYLKNLETNLFVNARSRAKRKNIEFAIDKNDIKSVIPIDNICPLLQIKMDFGLKRVCANSFTLDRIDPNKGYIKNNIQVISFKANTSKNNSTIEEYELIVNNLDKIIKNNILYEEYKNVDMYIDIHQIISHMLERTRKYKLPKSNIGRYYIRSIYPKNNICPLLNVEMKRHTIYAPSVDRIVPELGYVKGNVMFISRRANIIKNNLSLDEMKLLIKNWKRLYENII